MTNQIEPLLAAPDLDRLRTALEIYTADAVHELLGPIGRAAHERGDLAGVARIVRAAPDSPLRTMITIFLLGAAVPVPAARDALHPLPLDAAVVAGLVEQAGDEVRARLEIRPYTEAASRAPADSWWVLSDLGSDVRPGPLARDHVLGIGNAALTLAQATPRRRVGSALDIGTGCGVQALHLARHADRVVATDISRRALRLAATTAALSGQQWDLREGSLAEPAAGDTFDLVVANPPFVVSPGGAAGRAEFDYRDSGLAGDEVCRALVRSIPAVLAPGGTAQLLANWIIPTEGTWQERLTEWFAGTRCDGWVWQREVADLGEYVTMWLRDAGFAPGTPDWTRRYDDWLDWFDGVGVAAIGMGLITMVEGEDDGEDAEDDGDTGQVVFDDVPQAVEQPVGDEIAAWFDRQRHLSHATAADLVSGHYRVARDLVHTRDELLDADLGWQTRRAVLRQPHGLRWEVEVDDAVARIVAACYAGATPVTALRVLAATSGDDPRQLAAAFVPVLRDLVQRGFLVPTVAVSPVSPASPVSA